MTIPGNTGYLITDMTGNPNPIAEIAARFGSQTDFARAMGKRQSTVWEWISKGRVPSTCIPDVIEAGARHEPPITLEPNDFFSSGAETRAA